jgi:hypothetical protein
LAQDPMTKSIEDLQNGIENQHPFHFYVLAMKLFQAGRKRSSDAVFWFYADQLRYRIYLIKGSNKNFSSFCSVLFGFLPLRR